jgi:hypothetical protein
MSIGRNTLTRLLCCGTVALAVSAAAAEQTPRDTAGVLDTGRWGFRFYLDLGYALSSTDPANGIWRSKSTTFKLDSVEVNQVMARVAKRARPESRWGFTFGVQSGVDTDDLAPSTGAVSHADTWRHLYRANVSYRFGGKRERRLTFGLINSYIGYESYLSLQNPNYTRGYLLDVVPYFLVGGEFSWKVRDGLFLRFYLVTGYQYLVNPNDAPSYGAQVTWLPRKHLALRQNLYYGPDQSDTSLDYWRFLSDSLVQWKTDRWLVAAAFDYVTERQAEVAGQPRFAWTSAALWVKWNATDRLSLTLRPDVLDDQDGLATGFRQRIQALTGTLKYDWRFEPHNKLQLVLELRRDRSTGPEGGFFDGPTNSLVEYQNLALIGVTWQLERIHALRHRRGGSETASGARVDPGS